MSARVAALVIAGAVACGGQQHGTLPKAGSETDEGAGELAQASVRLITADENERTGLAERRSSVRYDYPYGGGMYGGDPYGGGAYGGATYAGWTVPQWSYAVPNRIPRYNMIGGLRGAIEGTVSWNGPVPAKVATACGPLDNPTLRIGTDKALRGVVVYIENVAVGRAMPYYGRPATVGGVVGKRGCALVPAAQIAAPLPTAVSIHGDGKRTKLRVTQDKAPATTHDLQEGGLVQLEAKHGVLKVEGADGKLAAAWVLGLETPYYAITDDHGRYRIDELAPGTYEVTFWQPPIATAAPDGTFSYGAPIVVRRKVRVGGTGKAAELSVTLSHR